MKTDNLEAADLLKWWQQQHTHRLKREADFIRNDVLQEVFTMRRRLELCHKTCDEHDGARQMLACTPHSISLDLERLEHIHLSLGQLSDRLDPPYVQASLPLALGHAASLWNTVFPFSTRLPTTWHSEPVAQTRLLLVFLNTLCAALGDHDRSPQSHPRSALPSCQMTLRQTLSIKALIFDVTYRDRPLSEIVTRTATELAPIVQTLQTLTNSSFTTDLQLDKQPNKIVWKLSWSA